MNYCFTYCSCFLVTVNSWYLLGSLLCSGHTNGFMGRSTKHSQVKWADVDALLPPLCLQAGHSPLINPMWMFIRVDIQHFSLTNNQSDSGLVTGLA